MKEIYLDNAATTKVDENTARIIEKYMTKEYGNASSVHSLGRRARKTIDEARKIIAKSINALPEEIYFTSGGTEGNNWALKGLFMHQGDKKHIITTKTEHDSILEVCKWLEKNGCKVTYLNVDKEGFVDLKELENAIGKNTLVVSIIHANNEIGTIQNLEKIGKICKNFGVLFHIDACQSYTKVPINVKKQNISLMTLNAHKIHGPKGVGALYIKKGVKITPQFHGGGHEKGMRSGTENVPGIAGFAKAVRNSSIFHRLKMRKLRDYIIKKILEIPDTKLNGAWKDRLCNNINVSFKNIEGEAIGSYLSAYGIYVSTGSACASNNLKKSHVLKAIGLNDMEINSSIRISLSKYTTKEDAYFFINKLKIVIERLRKISPFA